MAIERIEWLPEDMPQPGQHPEWLSLAERMVGTGQRTQDKLLQIIGVADANFVDLDARATAAAGDITALETGLAAAEADIIALEDALAALAIVNANKVINGDFDLWQRGTSASAAGYLADRWSVNRTGSTFVASRQAFALGQTDVPGEPTYFHRAVVTSVAGAGNHCDLKQPIEGVRTLAGKTATLSFYAKADAPKSLSVEFEQNFGSGGAPSAAVTGIGATKLALTAAWQKFTVQANIPSIAGKTLGSAGDALVARFWFDAGTSFNARTVSLGHQSGTFDIARVKLEEGAQATPFEPRPLGQELALSQRYYEIGAMSLYEYVNSAMQTGEWHMFKATKRAAPTIAVTGVGTSNVSSGSLDSIGDSGFRLIVNSAASGTVIYNANFAASAEL